MRKVYAKFTPDKVPGMTIRNFYNKRNKILIWHEKGGLGDVFMQRMMFDDFKEIAKEADVFFACLPEYLDAVADHPAISGFLDARSINPNDYLAVYNTCVSIADRYENIKAPNCEEHRSDIWAKYCGIKLKSHEMRIQIDPELSERCRKELKATGSKPIVLFAPISKMAVKTLLDWQIKAILEELTHCTVLGLDKKEIKILTELGISGLYNKSLKEWLAYISHADYVVSVDTAAFHAASGLKRPLMGIFTFADGRVYGKYADFVLVQKHRKNGNWDCGPCFKFGDCPKSNTLLKPCLTELSIEELKEGIKKMFNKWPEKQQN